MAQVSGTELVRLSEQVRVYDRLDWWTLNDWRNSDAFWGLIVSKRLGARRPHLPQVEEGALGGAMLVIPIDYGDVEHLQSSRSSIAWIRWCAVHDGVSPSTAMQALMNEAARRLRQANIQQLWCISETQGWMGQSLKEIGFGQADNLITMAVDRMHFQHQNIPPLPAQTHLQVLHVDQTAGLYGANNSNLTDQILQEIGVVDEKAFEAHWHYSDHMLRSVFEQSAYITAAIQHKRIVGYQCTVLHENAAHITRLAVSPEAQHQGIATALLSDCLHEMALRRASEMTLNTPASNNASQRLYQRFGFTPTGRPLAVLKRDL